MNDNKSTVMNNAAVQQLRKVPGFDPMKPVSYTHLDVYKRQHIYSWC